MTGKRTRQRAFSDAAIQICLTMKIPFGMPLRQTSGVIESLLRLAGFDWKPPHFSTLCRRRSPLCWNQWRTDGSLPTRKNAQLWKPTTAGAIARNDAVKACKYPRRALWRKLNGYHRRSLAESNPLGTVLRTALPVSGWTVSNALTKASWHETSTDRSLNSRSRSLCSTATPLLAYHSQCPHDKSFGKRKNALFRKKLSRVQPTIQNQYRPAAISCGGAI
ncbi:transposase, IS4 family [Phaeobacter inhibens]|nr:transposase, IS4 family [Phaeobacter inhibens]AUQ77190.1 transposase, IS4 family [Phaeobacter inhibens]AUR14349.1 transposase, IS4 family [Phaeobacter inhibens]